MHRKGCNSYELNALSVKEIIVEEERFVTFLGEDEVLELLLSHFFVGLWLKLGLLSGLAPDLEREKQRDCNQE